MKIIKKIDHYLNDRDYKIITNNNYVNITNYTKILEFNSNNIDVEYDNKIVCIKGKDLVIKKMLNHELLIMGSIEDIVYR